MREGGACCLLGAQDESEANRGAMPEWRDRRGPVSCLLQMFGWRFTTGQQKDDAFMIIYAVCRFFALISKNNKEKV